MVLQFFQLVTDDNPGTGAQTENFDLPRNGVTKALVFDVTAQQSSVTAATAQNLAAQLDLLRLGAEESIAVSEVNGEDLRAYNALVGNHALFDSGTTDNSRVVLGMTYPLDPFCIGPRIDYNRNRGISGSVARKIQVNYAADGNNIDDKRLTITAINEDPGSTSGYLTFQQNSVTMSNGTTNYTDVSGPGRFLGILNFETTSAADVTTDGAHRTDQTIQEQSITVNRKPVIGPLHTTMYTAINGQYEIGGIDDEGYSLFNAGIFNTGKIGLPQSGDIPEKMEIASLGGDAADAARIYAITLNSNV